MIHRRPIFVSRPVARLRAIAFAAALATTVLSPLLAPGSAAEQATPATPSTALEWEPCRGEGDANASPVPPDAEGLECATVAVPLDYADPDGAQIAIGLNRLPAREPANRVGSLIFNPGGPGGSATELVAAAAAGVPVFTPAVRDHFDVVGMDPRGVGASTPVRCDPDIWNERVPRFPDDEAGFARLREYADAVGQSCLELTGPLLGHLDTVSAARDIELVRLALGDEPLNYLGLSYGTQLGATYAELYPGNIRAMVLDGALDHAQRPLAMLDNEARTHEQVLERFAAWCDAAEACALHGRDVLAVYDGLVATADETPIPALRCAEILICREDVTGEDIRFLTQGYLMFEHPTPAYFGAPGWEGLATALAAAEAGDASAFAVGLAQSEVDGAYAGQAIECVDWPTDIESFDDLAAYEQFARVVAPHTRGATQTWTILVGCMGWPVPVVNPPGAWDVVGAPPILIVNATHDPSTSYVWAHLMRQQIDGSVLLTRLGNGHTTYLRPGESRTRDAIDAYLVDLVQPPANAVYDS